MATKKRRTKKKRDSGKGIFHFLSRNKNRPQKTGHAKLQLKNISHSKAQRSPIDSQQIGNFKRLLHNLYFTKREEEIIEKERVNTLSVREINKDLMSLEKNAEKSLAEINERIRSLEESLSGTNNVAAELRKDNEDLRKEIKFLADKLNNFIAEKSAEQETEMPETVVEEGKSRQGRANADHGSERKIKTSLDQLLEIIMESGSVKISDAAKKLRVKDKQIEEWARVLEEHDLIEIHYPAFGKSFLKKKN